MATIEELLARESLHKLDAELSWREQEERVILLFPQAVKWLLESLPNAESSWNLEVQPDQQLDALARAFCAGRELVFEKQVKPLRHIRHGIWELKTADLRLFGWFHRRDWFICTAVNTAANVKQSGLYDGYRDEAVRLRDELDLDCPKFIPGVDPDGVLSAWTYPSS